MKHDLGELESDLISKIYSASMETETWREVLQSIAQICGVSQCTLFFYDGSCRARNFAVAAKIKDGMIDRYLMEFIDAEAAEFHKYFIGLREGEIVLPDDIVRITGKTYDQIVGNSFVDTFFKNMQFSIGIVLLQENFTYSGLGMRSFYGCPLFNRDAIDFLNHITPHLVQSMRIRNNISCAVQINQEIKMALECINEDVFLLDKNLRVIFSNSRAARLLESCAGLKVGRFGKLYLAEASENQQLQDMMQALIAPSTVVCSQGFDLAVASLIGSRIPLKFHLSRIAVNEGNELYREGVAVAICISDPNQKRKFPDHYMRQAYALTPTECSIMKALLDNNSVNDIAQIRGTTLETTRSQFKTVLQKTGTHSQSELSRLMMALGQDCV